MKKIKVLYIVGGTDDKYGASQLASKIISSIQGNYEVEYCVLTAKDGVINQFCKEVGVKNLVSCFKYSTYVPLNRPVLNILKHAIKTYMIGTSDRKAIKQIEKELDVSSFDIIHSNINRDLIGGVLSAKYGIPHIWHLQEMYNSHFGLRPVHNRQLKWMNGHCNHYIAISKTVAADWIKHGIDGRKTSVVYNGIELHKYIRNEEKETTSLVKLVMAGLIYKEKGQEDLIRAISLLPDRIKSKIRLDLYGEVKSDYYAYLKQLINDRELSGIVSFKGYCSNLPEILHDYDLGFNCSKGEGFGLSTIEFMASGVCPIVSNTGANTELVEDNKTGLVYSYGDIEDLKDKILRLVENKTLMKELGENARIQAMTLYSIDGMAKEIMEIYKNLVSK